jgi:hypothetical protein
MKPGTENNRAKLIGLPPRLIGESDILTQLVWLKLDAALQHFSQTLQITSLNRSRFEQNPLF